MRVRVRLFAILRDRAGVSETSLDLLEGATVADAARDIGKALPMLQPYLGRVAFAVNCDYAKPAHVLADGDELALIPAVSGGGAV